MSLDNLQPDVSVSPVQPMAEVPRSSFAELQLPSGYLDEAGVLHTTLSLREMTGDDEDQLANNKISIQIRMNRMLQNCIQSIGPYNKTDARWSDIVLSLPIIDRLWILIQLRIVSIGPIFSAKVRCQNEECAKFSSQNIDLNDFKVEGLAFPDKKTYQGVLPKSGKEFLCRIFNGHDEERLSKSIKKNEADLMSLSIASRLMKLGDKNAPLGIADVKALSVVDRQYLRNQFTKHEGSLDRSMECECPLCGFAFEEEIDLNNANFFFPSET